MTDQDLVVHVIDDNEANRDLLADLLDSVSLRSECHESAIIFLQRFKIETSGCLVLDVRMPQMSGLQLMERLFDQKLDIPIILTTAHGDVPMAIQAMKAGAFDFQEKPIKNQDMIDSIQRALQQRSKHLARAEAEANEREYYESLTPRERDVCRLVAEGAMNKQIAYDLGISQRTVEVHRASVMEKMHARSLADLIRIMVRLERAD